MPTFDLVYSRVEVEVASAVMLLGLQSDWLGPCVGVEAGMVDQFESVGGGGGGAGGGGFLKDVETILLSHDVIA